ncbi:MAG: SpoIIE family protein phosphatase, partial [Bacteroidetes bacterium]|nr:SpoIIE family protein phosphatase [Bacteroidota bacterium]
QQEKIWFGTENGLVVYQPQFDRKNTFEPITRIKSINLFSQKTDWKLFADSLDQSSLPVDLELAHDKNYLTFNFIGVSLTTPGKVKYRFMLKGLDKDWLPETSKTEAPYSNIPPGEYEFLVIANNGEGVWNKVPVSYKFVIHPPFWQTWWFYSIIAGIVLVFIYSYVKIKSANNKILKQNKIIADKNVDLKTAYGVIADKNKSITDSINYAKRIQQSFLSSEATLNKTLKNYFIMYKPRDIVSGDFYWAFDLPDRVIIACADSTGHGIPGAFMSLIGISLLNEISHSKNIVEPDKILDELRRIIICALNPQQLDSGGKDGMDISLISIFKNHDSDDVKIHFSGANNAIYIISNQNDTANFLEFKSDKQPVGFYSSMKPFTFEEIIVKKGDIIYMGTDGFSDQFGGIKGKKFMSKQLKKKLFSIHDLPLKEQENILENTFQEWKGELEQVDDVTIMGIRI